MRSECMCNGEIINIADIYQIIDGKQINIPERLRKMRDLSHSNELFCSCGCGENVVLVAGERNLRRQHFRVTKKFNELVCEYKEETEESRVSKVLLKLWFEKNMPGERNICYNFPICNVVDSNNKYELTLYSPSTNIGLVYVRQDTNIMEGKLALISQSVNTKVLYVTSISNENTNGQYPEYMMKIQQAQGFCFYLKMNENSLYQDAEVKLSIYEKDYKGLWRSLNVCSGSFDDFSISDCGQLKYKNTDVNQLITNVHNAFQEKQNAIQENIKRQHEEQMELQKKREMEREEKRKQEENRVRSEEIERQEQREQIEKELKKEAERRKIQKNEYIKTNLEKYKKLNLVYNFFLQTESITGTFFSDQSDGKQKQYKTSFKVEKVKVNVDKHRVEISGGNRNAVYIYVIEEDFQENIRLGTGSLYRVLDFTEIDLDDIEGTNIIEKSII